MTTRSTAELARRCAGLLAGVLFATGCGTKPPAAAGAGSALGRALADAGGRVPAPLAPFVASDRADGTRNEVLHAMHAGKLALEIGALRASRGAFDLAYQRIETVYADNPAAAKARSRFVPEATKDFKGEPFERAMLGYYLGLGDLLQGDLDNARAAFRWGEFQDTMSASEQYQGDMASLRFLVGWADHCERRHRSAEENFRAATEVRAEIAPAAPHDNVLVLVEAGQAPQKARAGQHGEALTYSGVALTTPDTRVAVQFAAAGAPAVTAHAVLAEDIHWQATTLGGRAVDRILAGKAAFKENATTAANTGAAVATAAVDVARVGALSGDRNMLNIAGATAVGGLLISMVGSGLASATRAEADIRRWSSLPGAVFLATARVDGAAAAATRVSATLPPALGGRSVTAALVPVPGTPCHVARLSTATAPAWNAQAADAFVDIAAAERSTRPAVAAGDTPERARDAVKTAPVRGSF